MAETRWQDKSVVGRKIRRIRQELGMSQAAFATAVLGYAQGQSHVSRWERGDILPSPENLERIAELAGRDVTTFQLPGATPTLNPDFSSFGLDFAGYDRLKARAREMFDRFVVDLIGRGIGREDIQEIGQGVLAPIAAMNTLHKSRAPGGDGSTEEEQLQILEALIPVARRSISE